MGAFVNYSNRVELLKKKWNKWMNQITFDEFDEAAVQAIIRNPQIQYFQISCSIPENKLELINQLFLAREDLTLRIYHFLEEQPCDLSFLRQLNAVKKLSIDTMKSVSHLEVLKTLSLNELHLNVLELKDFSIIKELSLDLEGLFLYNEASGKVFYDTEWLVRYKKLKTLYLGKLSKGIEMVRVLENLNKLTLRGIKVDSLAFLNDSNVTELAIHWCSMNDLSSLAKNSKIQSLELWRIMKLEDLSFISQMPNLKKIQLQDLANLQAMPSLKACGCLEEIYLEHLKLLSDVQAIACSKSVKKLTMIGCQKLSLEAIESVFKNDTLKLIHISGAGNHHKAKTIDSWMQQYQKVKK